MKTKTTCGMLGENKHPRAGKAMTKSIGLALCGLMLGAAADAAPMKVDKNRSRIQVDAKATGHAFTATLEDYTAKVSGDAATLKPQVLELAWTFDDLKTGEADRDREMIKWLGGGKPAGSFKFIKTWDEGGEHLAMGTLTVHGVGKTIAFPYTVKKEGDWVTIDGTASMDYTNFGLPVIRSMAVMTVKPGLSIRFHLVGKI